MCCLKEILGEIDCITYHNFVTMMQLSNVGNKLSNDSVVADNQFIYPFPLIQLMSFYEAT